MRSMDCTDIKALLSGLVDDELDADTRYDAERHLGQCKTCRQLIDEAEALDELVRADLETLEPSSLPAGFEDAVLRQTVYTTHSRPYSHQWTTWTGWVAAAACLALAFTIWIADRRAGLTPGRVVQSSDPVVFEPGVRLRSLANEEAMSLEEYPAPSGDLDDDWVDNDLITSVSWSRGPALVREDAETLYMSAVLLHMFEETAGAAAENLQMIRDAIDYDDVLSRLGDAVDRLDTSDRELVRAAQAILLQIEVAGNTGTSLEELRLDCIDMDLAASIDQISRRWEEPDPV